MPDLQTLSANVHINVRRFWIDRFRTVSHAECWFKRDVGTQREMFIRSNLRTCCKKYENVQNSNWLNLRNYLTMAKVMPSTPVLVFLASYRHG
jgi:hypothetical protein